jgi:hypothetical protein
VLGFFRKIVIGFSFDTVLLNVTVDKAGFNPMSHAKQSVSVV